MNEKHTTKGDLNKMKLSKSEVDALDTSREKLRVTQSVQKMIERENLRQKFHEILKKIETQQEEFVQECNESLKELNEELSKYQTK